MMEGAAKTRYALWLVPQDKVRGRLAKTIRKLSRKYATPAFQPHVTLVSGIVAPERQVMAKAAKLAKEIPPLRLRFAGYGWKEEYFRCVFVRAAKTRALIETHRKAKKIFALGRQRPFMPHLSLVYGNLEPRTKREIIARLPRGVLREMTARRLELVKIRGEPSKWKRVRSWELK